jgi:hypothetical protein
VAVAWSREWRWLETSVRINCAGFTEQSHRGVNHARGWSVANGPEVGRSDRQALGQVWSIFAEGCWAGACCQSLMGCQGMVGA